MSSSQISCFFRQGEPLRPARMGCLGQQEEPGRVGRPLCLGYLGGVPLNSAASNLLKIAAERRIWEPV